MRKKLSLILAVITCMVTLSVPANASSTIPIENTSRIISDELFEDLEPTNVETTYNDGRVITVTTYTLDDGEIITDTFERSAMTAYSLEGQDTATRKVDGNYGTVKLTASFKWWTSSGKPGTIGSWQSVECTSASATYTPVNDKFTVKNKKVTTSDGALAFGKAWAKASALFYMKNPNDVVAIEDTYSIKITCDDNGNITNS